MIVVVSLNPALDVTHYVDGADWSGVNRPHEVHVRAGGKGLNVARTLRALGQPVLLAGLAGGCTGQALAAGLASTGIEAWLTPIAGETRRTFVVADSARGQTALFNEPGPPVTAAEFAEFSAAYERAVSGAAVVVLSGSLPPGLPDDAYAGLTAIAAGAGVPVILDASGAPLRLGAAAGPALIKPNLAELEAVAGRELRTGGEPDLPAIEQAARDLPGQPGRGFRGSSPGPARRGFRGSSPGPVQLGRGGLARGSRAARDRPRRHLARAAARAGRRQPDGRRRRRSGWPGRLAGARPGLAGHPAARGGPRQRGGRGRGRGRVRSGRL